MNTVAYCAHSWRYSTRMVLLSAGIVCKLRTSPMLTNETFPYKVFINADLIYLSLHGIPEQSYLYGDGMITALSAGKILDGPEFKHAPVVVMEGCNGLRTIFPETFVKKGASVVLADIDESIGRRFTPGPSGKLGRDFVWAMRKGMTANAALEKAYHGGGKNEGGYCLVGDEKVKLL